MRGRRKNGCVWGGGLLALPPISRDKMRHQDCVGLLIELRVYTTTLHLTRGSAKGHLWDARVIILLMAHHGAWAHYGGAFRTHATTRNAHVLHVRYIYGSLHLTKCISVVTCLAPGCSTLETSLLCANSALILR